MPQTPETIVRQFFTELGKSGQSLEVLGRYLAEDCVWDNSGFPSATGRTAAIALMEMFIDRYDLDRLVVEVRAAAANGDVVLTERIDHMDDTQGHRRMTLPVSGTLVVKDGKIVRWSDYFDPRAFLNA